MAKKKNGQKAFKDADELYAYYSEQRRKLQDELRANLRAAHEAHAKAMTELFEKQSEDLKNLVAKVEKPGDGKTKT